MTAALEWTKKKIQTIDQREKEIDSLPIRLGESEPLSADREAELKALRHEIGLRLDGASFEQKRLLLDLLQIECVYHDDAKELMVSGVFGSQALPVEKVETAYRPASDKPEVLKQCSTLSDTSAYCQ